ncbi:MAG: SAM-dependent methyltransferase [Acidimicrobiia bacterium]|nr:SAM-dependent methyltransferase [Acidimicrobiia bacterium]
MADADKSVPLTGDLHRYLVDHGTPPDEVELALIAETRRVAANRAGMQIAPEQGGLLTMLARLVGARRAVEVGTFTGYSALCLARGLPPAPEGRLLCLDVSAEWTAVGRPYWEAAGVADRIEVRIAPAAESLRALPLDEPIDLAFVDADKTSYVTYYEELVARLRPGGLLVADNVLWGGRVADDTARDADTVALRAFNDHVAADERVDRVMLAIADGITLVRKR